jgi:hypothetical protein
MDTENCAEGLNDSSVRPTQGLDRDLTGQYNGILEKTDANG